MSANNSLRRLGPVALTLAIACALGARKDEPAADALSSGRRPATGACADPGIGGVGDGRGDESDQLRDAASKAYGENRLYAPAGNNAMEYYLALRDSNRPTPASSALTDLMPMTVIASEQAIAREDFAEAKRLVALIEKAD